MLILIYLLTHIIIIFQEAAVTENKKYVIPLTVRQYASVIESNFPDIMEMNNLVPKNVWEKTPAHSPYLVTRKYKWLKILCEGLQRNMMITLYFLSNS